MAVSPGEKIREELDRRGWTQGDLAHILNRPLPTINEIIGGKRAVMPETAIALESAFGTPASEWMRLEAEYRLSLTSRDDSNAEAVARRVRLYDLAPVKELERRGWIQPAKDASALEKELCRFFGVTNLDSEPQINVATRRSEPTEHLSPPQRAWCFRAKQMARVVHAEKFKRELLPQCEARLRELAAFPDEARQAPTVLAGFGIRFVVIEPLSASKMDGAALWLSSHEPVIAMSVRHDRIDAFWFTLFHEFAHIKNGDASVDVDLVGESAYPSEAKPDIERLADAEASRILVPADKLQSFITRVGPLYSKVRINQFAHRMKIHPGIIVGQLQHRGEVKWTSNREMLTKVRSIVLSTALTDGWGKSISVDLSQAGN
ncbi:MAG TPA: helix-turn-helix domain-containing protein [Tepidisphaeraceae bacterium]|jgi:HTH-type transcriptional regulator/antitoxin HigA|nr:helix-turn-helix domain-containing protein [Tepidisphaeraceae bacterium]